jgi:RNA-directed DNA polymerase
MDQTLLRQWLKAGFLEKQAWFATTEGTPPGGTISDMPTNWIFLGPTFLELVDKK